MPPSPIGQPELLRLLNRVHASTMLRRGGVLSRTDLARHTGLSRATIAILITELLRVGLVEEIGLGQSSGGRPPKLLRFRPDAAVAIGAVLEDRHWTIVATDLHARVLHRERINVAGSAPEAAIEALQRGVTILMPRLKAEGHRILPAIGLGTPGLVDTSSGTVITAVDVGWANVPMQDLAEQLLGIPARVANRSRLGALAELWQGVDRDVRNLIFISISTGIAAGIVNEGELITGTNSSAGELGHFTVDPDGPLCPCGNRGCLQQFVSEPAISNRARARLRLGGTGLLHDLAGNHPERLTSAMIFDAAIQGDALAREIVDEAAEHLGVAVANLVNVLNPELIVLGGPLGQTGSPLLDPVRTVLKRRALAFPASAVEVITTTVGPDAGAVGAAVLVLQQAIDLLFAMEQEAATPPV